VFCKLTLVAAALIFVVGCGAGNESKAGRRRRSALPRRSRVSITWTTIT
jgi:hypothetical protein